MMTWRKGWQKERRKVSSPGKFEGALNFATLYLGGTKHLPWFLGAEQENQRAWRRRRGGEQD